ncbi:pentatricopeptide repeat-containing-like protein [Cinnamomum micranthum f. kanehirae]|uniref:Pentatricopeptide repeat-containing-like protein n=1 Tax=Cinnamomum micranthum f. kanehirae TaxID=337451 RepID=A0A3S3QMS7_9MAGN|nr:pentatricopeptide repeat-containing-like protein [Cinnamomum micranthum f. kanehirae]
MGVHVVASLTPTITTLPCTSSHSNVFKSPQIPITIPSLPKSNTTLISNTSSPFSNSQYCNNFHTNFQTLFHKPSLDSHDYAYTIESCDSFNLGRQIHAHTLKAGFGGHEFLETKLLHMYGRCGCVESAELMFDRMPFRNIYSWVGAVTVFSDHGLFEKALLLFQQMLVEGVDLEFFIFPVVLKACSGLGDLELGGQLHGFVIKRQFVVNVYVGNALIDMYGKCGCLDGARWVFENMPERDCVSWNSMVTGCASNGLVTEALEILEKMSLSDNLKPNLVSWSAAIGGCMQNGYDEEALALLCGMQAAGVKPNARTLASVLPSCARLQNIDVGRVVHGYITRHEHMSNSFVVNGLVDVYRKCGEMGNAWKIFTKYSMRNLVSFNTMIVGYCENGEMSKAKELFDQMELVGIPKDTISWNSMISGYVDNGQFDEALKMFRDMQMEVGVAADTFTLGSILSASTDMAALRVGKEIHSFAIARGLQSNAFVGGALVDMYCRCQDLVAAQKAFDEISERETATWNALISGYASCNHIKHIDMLLDKMRTDGLDPNIYTWNGILTGYVQNEHNELALQMFFKLQNENLKPDIYTVGIALHACSCLATTERGKQIHALSIRQGFDTYVHIGSTLVDMYAKCGSIKNAWMAFNRILQHDLVSWNTMLAGYAMHGHEKEGISLFQQMQLDGIKPDAVTFLAVLTLCSHAGSVDEGQMYFDLMVNFGIKPSLKHYTCLVDLLSRAGRLWKAYKLIKQLPMEPDAVMWGSFLSGCVIHGNIELGEIAANKLIELGGSDAGNYVLLANLYASAGRWDDLARTRQIIKDRGMQKIPGCSWIEDKDQIHVFAASDRSHEQTDDIYAALETLTSHMKKDSLAVTNLIY